MEDASSEVAIPDNMTLKTVADAAIVTTAETTVVTRQDPPLPRVVIQGGDFPVARIGETIQNQSITKQKLVNCTIINKYFVSGGAYGYHPPNTDAVHRDGVAVAGLKEPLALPQCSSTEIVENSGDDDYTYLDNDMKIQRHPLRKGTKIFRGRQIHPCSFVGEDAWRDVAIKIVHASHNSDKEVRRLIKLAEHHNIVKILQSGKSPGPTEEIFIVMELCSRNLSEFVLENSSKQSSFAKKATFAKQFISGLRFIHKNKIVHGDLKPDNLLFSMSGDYLKISDFGMSKDIREGQSKSSESGSGTDGFRAPELYVPGAEASYESDMFSFGIITFYLFTDGKHPYGDDHIDWSYNIKRNADKPNLAGVPDSLDTVPDRSQLLQLLPTLLKAEPASRPTSEEVKSHSFFKGVNIDVEDSCKKLKEATLPKQNVVKNNLEITLSRQSSPPPHISSLAAKKIAGNHMTGLKIDAEGSDKGKTVPKKMAMKDLLMKREKMSPSPHPGASSGIVYSGHSLIRSRITRTVHVQATQDGTIDDNSFYGHHSRHFEPHQATPPKRTVIKLTDSIEVYVDQSISIRSHSHIYPGKQHSTGLFPSRDVAIKLSPYTAYTMREAKHLLKLTPHANIVAIIHTGITGSILRLFYIVMEMLNPVTLEDYINKRRSKKIPFNPNEAIAFSKQLIDGVCHIHANGIIHGGLNPGNVLFSLCGRFLKIASFGYSKALEDGLPTVCLYDDPFAQRDGYRAPETYSSHMIRKENDVFSLGILLSFMWSYGHHPFGGVLLQAYNIKNHHPPVLTGLLVAGKETAADLVQGMLRNAPENRSTITEVKTHQFNVQAVNETLTKTTEVLWTGSIQRPLNIWPTLDRALILKEKGVHDIGIDQHWKLELTTVPRIDASLYCIPEDKQPVGYLGVSLADNKYLKDYFKGNKSEMGWINMFNRRGQRTRCMLIIRPPEYDELYGALIRDPEGFFAKLNSKRKSNKGTIVEWSAGDSMADENVIHGMREMRMEGSSSTGHVATYEESTQQAVEPEHVEARPTPIYGFAMIPWWAL